MNAHQNDQERFRTKTYADEYVQPNTTALSPISTIPARSSRYR